MPTRTQLAINARLEADQETGFRTHLGASIIGRECAREVWYVFRWAARVQHEARMLRLFDRGQLEEQRFIGWLRSIGVHVEDVDPSTGKQWRVGWARGHAGGSMDSKLFGLPDIPDAWAAGEYKTHGDKSFQRLKKDGVQVAKWEHYVQMQIYMHFMGLGFALYLAINKNDDELYTEVVTYNADIAAEYVHRAERIIEAEGPPPRVNESPAWFKCRFCDFKPVCHLGEPLARNCRTCVFSRPTDNGTWTCTRYNYVLSADEQLTGCTDYTPIQ
jgi:hypothetical protein